LYNHKLVDLPSIFAKVFGIDIVYNTVTSLFVSSKK